MKKLILTFVLLLILAPLVCAQESGGSDDKDVSADAVFTDEEVMEAAGTMFSVFIYGAAGMEYGQVPEGISYDEKNEVFRYENLDVTGLSEVYSKVDGTIKREGKDRLVFDFSLTGGPIRTMKYRIGPDSGNPQGMSAPSDLVVNGEMGRAHV